jgi:hypothetical protein
MMIHARIDKWHWASILPGALAERACELGRSSPKDGAPFSPGYGNFGEIIMTRVLPNRSHYAIAL